MSQRRLGIEAGIDEAVASTRVNRYELGVHAPDYGTSSRIAKALGIPVAYLYCDDDELAALILAYRRAPALVRKKVKSLLSI